MICSDKYVNLIFMNYPLVSVIVPNYNYAQYLDQRMESILNQSYQNFEVVILDDKSTDNSLEVIEKYRNHSKVSKVIVNETNSGSPFKQWECGINNASGDIIWIAESDDYCTTDFLETLVPLYVKNHAVLTFCHSELVDEKGDKLRENHQMSNVHSDISMDGKAFIKRHLAFSNEVQNASCAIFSKKASLEIDKEYMNYKGAGDWLFWIKIAEKGNVSFASAVCNNYRLHNNTTSKVVKSGLEFREMKSIYERLLKDGYLDETKFQRCRRDNLYLILSLNEIPNSVKNELYRMWDVSLIQTTKMQMKMIKNRMLNSLKRYFISK